MTTSLANVKLVAFDFDGVFTDNHVWTSYGEFDGVTEAVRCWRGDGIGLERLKALGIHQWVISGEPHDVVKARCEKLGLPFRNGVKDKLAALKTQAFGDGVALPLVDSLDQVAYL